MDQPIRTHFRNTRTVMVFGDRSELLFLPDSASYVWQRPNSSGKGYSEVALAANTDQEAVVEVRTLAQQDFCDHLLGGHLFSRSGYEPQGENHG